MLEYFPIILSVFLLVVFAVMAVCVKQARITSCVVLITAIVNLVMLDSYNMLAAQGETIGLLIMGSIDMLAALSLMIIYFGNSDGAGKAPQQALVFILFALSHGWLAFELAVKQYYFYEVYDYVLWGLTLAHILVMGGYYEEIKRKTMGFVGVYFGLNAGSGNRIADRILRNNRLDYPDRHRGDGGIGDNRHNHGREKSAL